MIIDSPVGKFPFYVRKVEYGTSGFEVEGSMGTWPTTIKVDYAELPRLLKALATQKASAVSIGVSASLITIAILRMITSRK